MPRRKSRLQKVNCKVCDSPTSKRLRCGAQVCESCKKFFLRNRRNKGKFLICVSPSRDCQMDPAKSSNSCPRCRYDRCLAAGMHLVSRFSMPARSFVKTTEPSAVVAKPFENSASDYASFSSFSSSSGGSSSVLSINSLKSGMSVSLEMSCLGDAERSLLRTLLLLKDHPSLNDPILSKAVFEQLTTVHGRVSTNACDVAAKRETVDQLMAIVSRILGFSQ